MEAASQTTLVKVSYLADAGPADSLAMLNTLALRDCGLIITTSDATSQVAKVAAAHPRLSFLIIGSVALPKPSQPLASPTLRNVRIVSAAAAQASIDTAIRDLAKHARPVR